MIENRHVFLRGCWAMGLALAVSMLAGCGSTGPARNRGEDSFTIVVLPDTQNYTDSSFGGSPEYFYDQTRWIRENQERLNIVLVAHVGDIVQNAMSSKEWDVADKAFQTLDGHVPYILCLGNHDIADDQGSGPGARRTLLNDYFPPSRFMAHALPETGAAPTTGMQPMEPGRSDNAYLTFTAAGMPILAIALEFKPRDHVLAWANQVVASHPSHHCLVVTHGYLDADGERKMGGYAIPGNNPPYIWEKFVRKHENIFLVVCGHILGESCLSSTGTAGNTIHQVLTDYQNDYVGNGGSGYLRIMTFVPGQDRIENRTYSPTLDTYLTRPRSEFTLGWPPAVSATAPSPRTEEKR